MTDVIVLSETALFWIVLVSITVFVVTVIMVPWLVVRIPADYFAYGKRHKMAWSGRHPLIRWVMLIAKNILGCIFIVMGLAMLFLPGQGLLTILTGVMLLNFPGKYRLECWFISKRPVLLSVNWLRRKAHRSPLIIF